MDAAGNLYIADRYNLRVSVVSTSGIITTVAGNGTCCYGGDGGLATGARLDGPSGVAVDAAGHVTVVDQNNNAVRLLTPTYTLPVLSIQSVHSGAFMQDQTAATYSVIVSNGAGAAPTNGAVTITEILPDALTLVTMAGSGLGVVGSNDTHLYALRPALSGASSYPAITVTVNVSATASGQLTNEVSVSGGGANVVGAEDLTIVAPISASAMDGTEQFHMDRAWVLESSRRRQE